MLMCVIRYILSYVCKILWIIAVLLNREVLVQCMLPAGKATLVL